MPENEKRIIKLIKYWIALNLIETLIFVIIFLVLPKDPKNAWLLGFSKNRLVIFAVILLYILALIYLFSSLSSSSHKIRQRIEGLTSYPSTNLFIDIINGLCLFVFVVCSVYLYVIISSNEVRASFHIRLIPIVIFISIVIAQILMVLVLLRLILEEEKLSLRNILDRAAFPRIRRGIYVMHNYLSSRISNLFTHVDNGFSQTVNKWNRSILTGIFILTPLFITFALLWISYTSTVFSYMPYGSDAIMYWRQTLTFVEHGFSGGNYTNYGTPPLAEFSAFGFHGPGYPVLYGLLGRLVGWEYYSGVLINLFFVTLALFLFTRLGNLSNKQLVTGIVFIATYWPVILYLSDNKVESINHAIAIVLAALFFKQQNSQENNWKTNIAICLILLISIAFRVTWSLLFFPLFFLMIFNYRGYKLLGAIVLSTAGVLLSFLYTKYFYNPGPDTLIFRAAVHGQLNIQEILRQIGTQVLINIRQLIDEPDTPFYIQVFRYQVAGMSLFIVFKLISDVLKRKRAIQDLVRSELMFHFFNIVALFASVLLIYHVADTRDYRNLSHSVLLSALLLILFSRYKYVYPIVLMNALLVFSFIPGFSQQRFHNFVYDEYKIRSFSDSISEYVKFDETESNRWCNTLALLGGWDMPLLAVDSGIGFSRINDVSDETKAKYILVPDIYYVETQDDIHTLGLLKLEETELGNLYLNPHSECK